jgi:hypothetical protein
MKMEEKNFKNMVDLFLWELGQYHFANSSDAFAYRVQEIAEKEISFDDKVSEIGKLIENYARYRDLKGYMAGLEMALQCMEENKIDSIKTLLESLIYKINNMIAEDKNLIDIKF